MIGQEQMQGMMQGQEPEMASQSAEVIVGNIADVIWTPVQDGGAFENMLDVWNQGGPEAIGAFAGHIIRENVDRLEGGATQTGEAMEVPRDDLLTIGTEVVNEMFEAVAVQVHDGAQTDPPFPQDEEELQDAQGVALIKATEAYTGTRDQKLEAMEPEMADFALRYMEGQNG